IQIFLRKYFACATINRAILDDVVQLCTNYELQLLLVNNVINSPVWKAFDAKPQCHIKILKYLIEQLEERKVEICSELYDRLIQLLTTQNLEFCHRIYLNRNFDKYIVIKEKVQQLSNGTTGLSCWQASCHLAHYLLGLGAELLDGRDVIELGAGCGLAGIAAAASARAHSVTLTDCNDEVLELIHSNFNNNFTEVIYLFDLSFIYVMFDPELAKPLAFIIRDILARSADIDAECVLAAPFIHLEQNHLAVTETFLFDDDCFTFSSGRVARDVSNFLFSSPLALPTVFHRIKYKE
uniref:FAM86 domain-containing protein n=1 Tax=Syphacia muris TaxID=451379 RepID=A0A0N5ASC1_9BILA